MILMAKKGCHSNFFNKLRIEQKARLMDFFLSLNAPVLILQCQQTYTFLAPLAARAGRTSSFLGLIYLVPRDIASYS